MSTIEASSTMTRSASSGRSRLRWKVIVFGSSSSSRCSVFASWPVASAMRLAARPVGAPSTMREPFRSRIWMMPFTRVVLPVPGPPVMTRSFFPTPCLMASRCSGARVSFCRSSNQAMARSTSMATGRAGVRASARASSAAPRSARCSDARYTAVGAPASSSSVPLSLPFPPPAERVMSFLTCPSPASASTAVSMSPGSTSSMAAVRSTSCGRGQ